MTYNIGQRLSNEFGDDIRAGSMVSNEEHVSGLLKIINPESLIEIGTLNGCSSAMFAHYASNVITIDIDSASFQNHLKAEEIWSFLKVREKIHSFRARDNYEKSEFIKGLNFDVAFIDGNHMYEDIIFDFLCVRSCGIVLFHDYKPIRDEYSMCDNIRYPDVVKVVDSLVPEAFIWGPLCGQFALWVSKNHNFHASTKLKNWMIEVS